jgi:hypothetical protein
MAADAVNMIPEPRSPRQLGDKGLIVFWRDDREPGERQGLACTLSLRGRRHAGSLRALTLMLGETFAIELHDITATPPSSNLLEHLDFHSESTSYALATQHRESRPRCPQATLTRPTGRTGDTRSRLLIT